MDTYVRTRLSNSQNHGVCAAVFVQRRSRPSGTVGLGRGRHHGVSPCLSLSLFYSLTHFLFLLLYLGNWLLENFTTRTPSFPMVFPRLFFSAALPSSHPRQWSALAPSANVRRCARVKLTLSHGEEEPVPERFAFTALGYANQAPTL